MALFFSLMVFAQHTPPVKETAMFGIKNKDKSYTLIRMTMTNQKPIIYTLHPNEKLELVKRYEDVNLFQKDYAFLEKLSESKDEELITAFYKDHELYELTGQKKSLQNYNDQTVKIYRMENDKRVLAATYTEMQFLYHSPYSQYLFIN